jgi:hypothetical protein
MLNKQSLWRIYQELEGQQFPKNNDDNSNNNNNKNNNNNDAMYEYLYTSFPNHWGLLLDDYY